MTNLPIALAKNLTLPTFLTSTRVPKGLFGSCTDMLTSQRSSPLNHVTDNFHKRTYELHVC